MYVLDNGNITIKIQAPREVYDHPRFSQLGLITSAVRDGVEYTTECIAGKARREGLGLACEYGIFNPPLYENVPTGVRFPKPGVGALMKFREDYSFGDDFDTLYADIRITQGDGCIEFSETTSLGEYSVFASNRISLDGVDIVNAYRVENLGGKPFVTEEYCHNFINLGQLHITGVSVDIDCPFDLSQSPKCISRTGRGIRFDAPPPEGYYFRFTDGALPRVFTMAGETLAFRETVDFTPGIIALWGQAYVSCVELFNTLNLQPGEKTAYTRRFSLLKKSEIY